MSKALTPVNQNDQPVSASVADRVIANAQSVGFPSYFGNFGSFNRLLILRASARLFGRSRGNKKEFPLITAFMAIV